MSRTSALLASLAAAIFGAACAGARATPAVAAAAPRGDGGIDVTLTTRDGVKLAATHWAGPASVDRCVVLVHQLSSTRDEWSPLTDKLRGRYEILAFDLRGHGGSTRGPRGELRWNDFGSDDWQAAVADLDAADRWLGERGFGTEDCVYVGSSIGSSLVVRFAATRRPAGIVLLSPGRSYFGIEIATAAATVASPRLVIASQERGAAETLAMLEDIWGGAFQVLQIGGTAHGVSMIAADPAIRDLVLGFVADPG
jgi:pimeloyl-ACP methyl ester carboxylesterase